MNNMQASLRAGHPSGKSSLYYYIAPIASLIAAVIPFNVDFSVAEKAYHWLVSNDVPMIDYYIRMLKGHEDDWIQRVVSIYIVGAVSPAVLISAALFSIKIVEPHRRLHLPAGSFSAIKRILLLATVAAVIAVVYLYFPGRDIVLTEAIPNAYGVKSSVIFVAALWALGGIAGLIVSDLINSRNE